MSEDDGGSVRWEFASKRTGSESHTETTTVCCPVPRSLEDPKNKKRLVNTGGGVVEEEGAHLPGSWLADCDTERREVRVL